MISRTSIYLLVLLFLASELSASERSASERSAGQEDAVPLAEKITKAFCDRSLVVLAELPSHGEAQAFRIKADIADRLIDQCGFDAVFFEAGVYDFLGFQEQISRDEATPEQLDNAMGGFWKTRGLADWRRRLFERALAGQLTLGGIDDQPSATSVHARAILPELVASTSPEAQAEACRETVERNLFWRYDDQHPFGAEAQRQLESCTRRAAEAAAEGGDSSAAFISRKMLENIAGYYARQLDPATAADRDEVMARNLGWQLDRMPDDSKVIVWTSTVHGARQQGELRYRPLGSRLAATWGERLAVVGFTAFAGESSMAGGPIRPIEEAPAASLEAKATRVEIPASYLDRAALQALGKVPSRVLGRGWLEAEWAAFFDGIVVIRKETAPVVDR